MALTAEKRRFLADILGERKVREIEEEQGDDELLRRFRLLKEAKSLLRTGFKYDENESGLQGLLEEFAERIDALEQKAGGVKDNELVKEFKERAAKGDPTAPYVLQLFAGGLPGGSA